MSLAITKSQARVANEMLYLSPTDIWRHSCKVPVLGKGKLIRMNTNNVAVLQINDIDRPT